MCVVDDSHISSAGLVILQDAIELIFLASLIELGVDEQKSLEIFTFNQLIGELRANGVNVPKSGTVKAMNKERVLVKHYGQLSEPVTVRTYLAASELCINEVLAQVFGKTIGEIWLHEFITNEETKECFGQAVDYLGTKKYIQALAEIRKALFIEIESEYSIYGWRDMSAGDKTKIGWFEHISRGGSKAAYWKKNKEWIEENVREPFDYVQIDHDTMRVDLMEWGTNTQDFWNLWRLTPPVFRASKETEWAVKKEMKYYVEAATAENVRYCLDKAIGLIVRKRSHFDLARTLHGSPRDVIEVETSSDPTRVYVKASAKSKVVHELAPGVRLRIASIVKGLDDEDAYINVIQTFEKEPTLVFGYMRLGDCKIVEE
jgi:hypothetical protein